MQAIQGVIFIENSSLIKIEINLCDKEKKALLGNLKVLTHFYTQIELVSSTFYRTCYRLLKQQHTAILRRNQPFLLAF